MAEQTIERMVVDGSPARCFEVVADIERYPEWVADLKEVHVHERDDKGRPSLVSFRAGAFGRSTSYTLFYDYSAAPSELRWVSETATSRAASTAFTALRPRLRAAPRLPTSSQSSFGYRYRASSSAELKATSSTPPFGT